MRGYEIVFYTQEARKVRHKSIEQWIWDMGAVFPWATLLINVLGSLLMGMLVGLLVHQDGHQGARLFLATGVLGGFTTFSTFSEGGLLIEREEFA